MAFKSKNKAREYNKLYMREKRLKIRNKIFDKKKLNKLKNLWLKGYKAKDIAKKINGLTTTDILGQIRYQNLKGNFTKEENKIRISKRKYAHYKENKKAHYERTRKWRLANPEKVRLNTLKQTKKLIKILYDKFISGDRLRYWSYVITRLRVAARKNKYNFDLTKYDLEKQWLKQKGKCTYTKISLTIRAPFQGRQNMTNILSFDRRNNQKGYVKGNVHFVSESINIMKSNLNEKDFINLCKIVYMKNKKTS